MEINILLSIPNFRLEKGHSILLEPICYSDNQETLKKLFGAPELLRIIGAASYETNYVDKFYGFSRIELDETDTKGDNDILQGIKNITSIALGTTNTFLQSLWLIKDHSSFCSEAVTIEPADPRNITVLRTPLSYTNCLCRHGDVLFSEDEINSAYKYALMTPQIFPSETQANNKKELFYKKNIFVKMGADNYHTNDRVARAFLFLDEARQQNFIIAKIALYMSVYECLFGDSNEIVYKIGERTAYYIGKNSDDKMNIYAFVKKAYNIRSKYLHGGTPVFDKVTGSPEEAATRLDNLTRKVLRKVLDKNLNDFKKEKGLDSWYLRLQFGYSHNFPFTAKRVRFDPDEDAPTTLPS